MQTEEDMKQEPWKYDPEFDEDQPFKFSKVVLYAPKN